MATVVKIEEKAGAYFVAVGDAEIVFTHEQAGALLYALRVFQSSGIRVLMVEAELYESPKVPSNFAGAAQAFPAANRYRQRTCKPSLWRRFLDWLDS
jgi:hypothetical protein